MYKYVQFGASSSAGLFSGRGCAVGGETWAKEPVQMQHMLMGAYRNVRGGGGVLSQQHESAEGKNVTRVCGLKARHFQGGPVKLDQWGRGGACMMLV